ncbi:MAG: hypothetical protein HWN65_08520 [Candidatus Helarchaeota archaeon]|nr:hypothetical protein [Candidatus Helarchaeota archaeon]
MILTIYTKSIFYKSFVEELILSSELLAGFLSALDDFASHMGGGRMLALKLGRIKFYNHMINNEANLKLVIIADKAANDSELKKVIKRIEDSILLKYSIHELKEYYSQPSYFNNLEPIITPIVDEVNLVSPDEISPIETLPYPIQEQPELILKKVSIPLLLKYLKKDLAKVVYGLFVGMRVVVTGDPALVSLIIDSMEIFSPHRNLRKAYWTNDIDESGYDIIGVSPQLSNLYLDSIRVNLIKKSVVGLKSNKYFDEIVKRLEKLKAEKVFPYIKQKFDFLFNKLRDFVDLINSDELSNKDLSKFSQNINRATLKVLESFLYWNNPKFYHRIKKVADHIRTHLLAEEVLL